MNELTYDQIKNNNLRVCPVCSEILEKNDGKIIIHDAESHIEITPRMWKHSEHDMFHALFLTEGRHFFLCNTDEFDENTLERIKFKNEEDAVRWSISIRGKIYCLTEFNDETYIILNDDGTILKDEEVEAMVFNYMMGMR